MINTVAIHVGERRERPQFDKQHDKDDRTVKSDVAAVIAHAQL